MSNQAETEERRPGQPHDGEAKPIDKTDKSADDHQEDLLDEGIEESFPASDPVSVKRIT